MFLQNEGAVCCVPQPPLLKEGGLVASTPGIAAHEEIYDTIKVV